MGKLLQLIILGLIAWAVFRVLQGKSALPRRTDTPTGDSAPPAGGVMRRCAFCQVHIPEGESTQSRGQYFCCEAHRDAFFREQR